MYKSILDKRLKIETTVAAIAFLCAATAILADVVGREFFGQGIWGRQNLQFSGLYQQLFWALALQRMPECTCARNSLTAGFRHGLSQQRNASRH